MLRITLFCLITQLSALSQIPQSDLRKIATVMDGEFQELSPEKSYPFSDLCTECDFIPSLTLYKDTTGVVYKNEFVLFRHPLAYTDGVELGKWIKMKHVSVEEYKKFQKYVRDSMAREFLYRGLERDKEASEFLAVNEKKLESEKLDVSKRTSNREIFPLNWKKKFSYSNDLYKPILYYLYVPVTQRYYKIKEFDERKNSYRYIDFYNVNLNSSLFEDHEYNEAYNNIPTLSNSYLWSQYSRYDRDIWNVHGQLYNTLFVDEKIIGITGAQANAFCNWKQEQLQKQLNDKNVNYTVVVSPPLKKDLKAINANKVQYELKEKDYTSQWRITAEEYEDFLGAVQDSVLLEELIKRIPEKDDILKLLTKWNFYYDIWGNECNAYDPSEYCFDRQLFHLNYSKKMIRKYSSLVEEIKSTLKYRDPVFVYWENDAYSRSIVGNLVPDGMWQEGYERDSMSFKLIGTDSLGQPIGLDCSLGSFNVLGHSNGVRAHLDFRRFHHRIEVSIIRKNNNEQKNKELIQGLTYKQAVAFYYWKYPIQFVKKGDDWHQYVIPSEEQFKRVQNGETVVVPKQVVDYPSPVFRYVVHILQTEK